MINRGMPSPPPDTARTSQSENLMAITHTAVSQTYAGVATQSDLGGYTQQHVPYVSGPVVGPRNIAQVQGSVQRRQEEELAEELAGLI